MSYCHFFLRNINLNNTSSSKYRSYHQKIAEWDLHDKPKKYVKHCLERIARVQNITSEEVKEIESNVGFISRIFQVKGMSKEGCHKVYLGDKYTFPICTGKDWKKFLMPYKVFLGIR